MANEPLRLNRFCKGWLRAYSQLSPDARRPGEMCWVYKESQQPGGYHIFEHRYTKERAFISVMSGDFDLDFEVYNGFKPPPPTFVTED